MSVTNTHPEYNLFSSRWRIIDDWLSEQDVIKARGETYLPKTAGMMRATNGNEQYAAYLARARAPSVLKSSLSGIIGAAFKKDPIGHSDESVTNTGLNVTSLARDVMRSVVSYGRTCLIVDAPIGGGDAYIAQYKPQQIINWRTAADNAYELDLLVISEEVPANSDEFGHETEQQYRVYRPGTVQIYNADGLPISEEVALPTAGIDAVLIGSINTSPDCDPVPLYPVAQCAIAAYQISADLRQDLYMSGQKQLYMTGCTADQYKANLNNGFGAGSAWYMGDEGGEAKFLESSGNSYADMSAERAYELQQAEEFSLRINRSDSSNEAASSLQIRASSQHANIYTIANSVSIGINRALQMRANWNRQPLPDTFYLQTDYTNSYNYEQMIKALNDAVNSMNAPRSALFETIRQAGLSSESNDEMIREISEELLNVPTDD